MASPSLRKERSLRTSYRTPASAFQEDSLAVLHPEYTGRIADEIRNEESSSPDVLLVHGADPDASVRVHEGAVLPLCFSQCCTYAEVQCRSAVRHPVQVVFLAVIVLVGDVQVEVTDIAGPESGKDRIT